MSTAQVMLSQKIASGGGSWVIASQWTPDMTSTGWSGFTLRLRLQDSFVPAGSQVRITIDNTGFPINLAKCYIQTGVNNADQIDFTTTPVQVTFGGSNTIISAGGVFLSDAIPLVQDGTFSIVVSMYFNSTTTLRRGSGAPSQGWLAAFKSGDDAATVNATGYSLANDSYGVTKLEVFVP